MNDDSTNRDAPASSVQCMVRQRPLAPEWHWQATGTNGGKIVGSCTTPKELGEMVTRLAAHTETEQIRMGKFRRDYDPMIPVEKMQEIMRELSNDTAQERRANDHE